MKSSPFTEGNAYLKKEPRNLEYRKETFTVLYHYYVCEDTGVEFTDDSIDNLNQTQVHNKYREKFGIPFVDEIREIRERYGLSAAKMSEVLGLGVNIYRSYESGEMPSVATGRLIRMAGVPEEFRKLLSISENSLEPHEYERVEKKIEHAQSGWVKVEEWMKNWLLGESLYPSIYNGYRAPTIERIGWMVKYFASKVGPFTTALNKLMFYADFGHFKEYGYAISGLKYKAIQRGPVPENYGAIYNKLVNDQYVLVKEEDFGEFVGEKFIAGAIDQKEMESLFHPAEIETLEKVVKRFKGLSTKAIVDISHQEPAWVDNVGDYDLISFDYGFELANFGN